MIQTELKIKYILYVTVVLAIGVVFQPMLLSQKAPSSKIQAEYDTIIQQADLANNPKRHQKLAIWCKNKRWIDRALYHGLEYRRYQFSREQSRLKENPSSADLKRLLGVAKRLKLENEQYEVKQQWYSAVLKERRAKIEDKDVTGLKALLSWAVKEGSGQSVKDLAEEVLGIDETAEQAHTILGHIKEGVFSFCRYSGDRT